MAGVSMCKVVHVLLWVIVLTSLTFAIQLDDISDELPSDDRQAQLDIAEGLLDTSLWNAVKIYVDHPLSVPKGELSQLYEVFSNLPQDLPVSTVVLSKYYPWKKKNVDQFFNDFSYLIVLKSMLSFSVDKESAYATLGVNSKLNGLLAAPTQSIVFTCTPNTMMKGSGRVEIFDTYARWRRRQISLSIPRSGTVLLGNFSYSVNSGLFYGYFKESFKTEEPVSKNWLFGGAATWNGLCLTVPVQKKSTLQTVIHARETEKIIGLKLHTTPTETLRFFGGCFAANSHRHIEQKNDTSMTVHAGATVTKKIIKAQVEGGVDILQYSGIPFVASLHIGNSTIRQSLLVTRIPRGFRTSQSKLFHTFSNKLSEDRQNTPGMTNISFSFLHKPIAKRHQLVKASYLYSKQRAVYTIFMKVADYVPFDYTLSYRLNSSFYHSLHHRIRLRSKIVSKPKYSIGLHLLTDIKEYRYWRILSELNNTISIGPAIEIAPFIQLLSHSTPNNDFALGVQGRLTFFYKTYGSFKWTLPIISHCKESFSFQARVNFCI